jgi:hypothetical protein
MKVALAYKKSKSIGLLSIEVGFKVRERSMLHHLMHLPFSTGFWGSVFALCAILALVSQVGIRRMSLSPSLALFQNVAACGI